MCSGMATPLGNHKGKLTVEPVCEATYDLITGKLSSWESPHAVSEENKCRSDCICPNVFAEVVLIYIFGDTHICNSGLQNIP